MSDAFICDALRTPIGRYGGSLARVRTDDLAARPMAEILSRNGDMDPKAIDDLYYGCANQAGEDNRNVARMAGLLAGLPVDVPACTVNRLCGSGMDAIGMAARSIKTGEASLVMAGGVESMSRAPLVMPKQETAFGRSSEMFDTTMGWRFINPSMKEQYGVDSMPETGENVAEQYSISRADQDAFAFSSQQRVAISQKKGFFAHEIIPVSVPQRRGDPVIVDSDEHPRADTSLEILSLLPTPFRKDGTVTAGNASGINDGACALLLASGKAARKHGLKPLAKVVGMSVAGVEPRIMGIGPIPATQKVLTMTGLELAQMDVIEINEAFASQSLAVIRELGLPDDAAHVNPNGGAIALGHPLGMTGARLVTTAAYQLRQTGGRYALCTMCIGVGQGIAMIIESV
ncbi:MAG: 3-oxoadipyl-CoA thiolase [Gammaproteobacteria bacterium]|nr:3-oxoadipyl-CoA thiolase [Gammaproteobacteria bacterium]